MLEMGKQSGEFFEKTQDEFGRKTYRLKSLEQYSREHNTKEQPSKKYFQASTLEEIIRSYPMPRKNMKQAEMERGALISNYIFDPSNNYRTQQSGGLYRFRAWLADDKPSGAVVAATSQDASFYHAAEVYRAFRAADESEVRGLE